MALAGLQFGFHVFAKCHFAISMPCVAHGLWISIPIAWMIPETHQSPGTLDKWRSDRIWLRDEPSRCLRRSYSSPAFSLEMQDNDHIANKWLRYYQSWIKPRNLPTTQI